MSGMLLQKVRKLCEADGLIARRDTVLAGISGGADSVCLFFVLCELAKEYDLDLHVLHVHHGLRETASADEAFVEELCRKADIPFHAERVDVRKYASEQGVSLEEGARNLRHGALDKWADLLQADKIALAHTENDQAETVLFRMFRGTGLKGMGGMASGRGRIIRPLLGCSRQEVEDYLQEQGSSFCTDETNLSDEYARNIVRHHVLPGAEKVNAAAVRHVAEAAQKLALAEDYISGELQKAYRECCSEEVVSGRLRVRVGEEAFLLLHPYMQERLIQQAICRAAGKARDISAVNVRDVRKLFGLEKGAVIDLPYGLQALRTPEGIELGRRSVKPGPEAVYDLPVDGSRVELPSGAYFRAEVMDASAALAAFAASKAPAAAEEAVSREEKKYTKVFDYDMIQGFLQIRSRRSGDVITVDREGHRQKLKKWLINEKIPREERDFLPLLAMGEQILWIPGYRRCMGALVTETTRQVLVVEYGPAGAET